MAKLMLAAGLISICLVSLQSVNGAGLEELTAVLSRPYKDLFTIEGGKAAAKEFWLTFGPGGRTHPAYFLEHKGHWAIHGVLFFMIVFLFLQPKFKPRAKAEEPLTDKEVDQLCKEWKPEQLVPEVNDPLPETLIISGIQGMYATVAGKQVLNLASSDYHNLTADQRLKATSKATIEKYGVGSCGPRGFYGTIDVHLTLEGHLAAFMGTPEAIIYSYDLATVSSIIPAFANRKDVLVVDEYCSYPIQSGCISSRAKVVFFKHNDMSDLELVLKKIDEEERATPKKPLNRRFIIVEGIYANYGDIAPLDKLFAIKEQYKYRLLVEESYSFGVLGATGRGACEHFGLQPSQVEIVCASMGGALASVGGFCVGDREVVDHQRLSGSGYCFSASLPPYLATSASAALHYLRDNGKEVLPVLAQRAKLLRRELRRVPGLMVYGNNDISPVIQLHLAHPPADERAARALLQRVADHMLEHANILVAVSVYSNLDVHRPKPSLRLYACRGLKDADIVAVGDAMRRAAADTGLPVL